MVWFCKGQPHAGAPGLQGTYHAVRGHVRRRHLGRLLHGPLPDDLYPVAVRV